MSINFRCHGGGKRAAAGSGSGSRGRAKTTENPFKEVKIIKVTEKDQSLFEGAFVHSVKYCCTEHVDSLPELKEHSSEKAG